MATEGRAESIPPGPETAVPRVDSEVRMAARRVVSETIAAKQPDASDPPTKLDKAVAIHKGLHADNPHFGIYEDSKISFASTTVSFGGEDYNLVQGRDFLATIKGRTEDGDLICLFRDNDGNLRKKADGSNLEVTLPQGMVVDAALFASRSELGNLMEGDDKALFDAYTQSLPQNASPVSPGPEAGVLIGKAAEKYNMLRVTDVQSFIDGLPDNQKNNPAIKDVVTNLQNGVLVTPEEFKQVLELTGHTKDSVDTKLADAHTSLDELRSKTLPDDATVEQRDELDNQIKAAEVKVKVLEHASDALIEPEIPEEESIVAKSAELQKVDEAFGVRMSELKNQVDVLEAEQKVLLANGHDLSAEKLQELENLRAHYNSLAYVTKLRGPAGIAFRRAAANQALLYAKNDSVTSAGTHQIRRVLREGAELAQEEARTKSILADKLEAAGIEENIRRSAQEVLSSPQKLAEYLSGTSKDAEMTALLNDPRLTEIMYEGNSTLDIDNFLSATEASLTDEQKDVLGRAKRWGKGGVLVGAGLAAILLALTGAAMVFVAKGVADSGRAA